MTTKMRCEDRARGETLSYNHFVDCLLLSSLLVDVVGGAHRTHTLTGCALVVDCFRARDDDERESGKND